MRTRFRTATQPLVSWTLTLVIVLGSCTPAFAAPTNAQIRAKQALAAEAQAKLDGLSATLEMRSEELAEVEAQLVEVRQKTASTERQLEKATAELEQARATLSRRATSIYRHGEVNLTSVFVGVTSFQDFLTRVDLLRRVGRSDASVVASVKQARQRVDQTKQALESRQEELVALRQRAREKQDLVEEALAGQQAYLASIKKDVARLIAAERAKQERLARERAAKQGFVFDPSKLTGAHADAARVALRFLGVKYVWGGTTPAGFDCSGLMQYAYREIGVDLP
ncbi:MAG: hypothetical protein FDZ75_07305, partial [Actinobacteria bacterium]